MAAVVGLFGVTGFGPHPGRFRVNNDAVEALPRTSDTFQRVWAQPEPNFRAADLSSDGGAVAAISNDGRVRVWDWSSRPNRPLWSRIVPGASQVTVSSGAHTVLAYAPLDPTQRTIAFLGAGGDITAHSTLDGAIWDVYCSDDGNYAGVSTGSHSLYLYTLAAHPALHRWQLGGIGTSLTLTPDGSSLAVGTGRKRRRLLHPAWCGPLAVSVRPAGADRSDRPAF